MFIEKIRKLTECYRNISSSNLLHSLWKWHIETVDSHRMWYSMAFCMVNRGRHVYTYANVNAYIHMCIYIYIYPYVYIYIYIYVNEVTCSDLQWPFSTLESPSPHHQRWVDQANPRWSDQLLNMTSSNFTKLWEHLPSKTVRWCEGIDLPRESYQFPAVHLHFWGILQL